MPLQKTSIDLDGDLWREFADKATRCGESARRVLEQKIREYVRAPDDGSCSRLPDDVR